MPRRYKKFRARKGAKVYEKSWKGKHVKLTCESSGVYRRGSNDEIKSHGVKLSGKAEACAVRSDGQHIHDYNREMIERERAAQKEAERRKSMVAPMYNKGAYQYVGGIEDAEVIKDLGRKK